MCCPAAVPRSRFRLTIVLPDYRIRSLVIYSDVVDTIAFSVDFELQLAHAMTLMKPVRGTRVNNEQSTFDGLAQIYLDRTPTL